MELYSYVPPPGMNIPISVQPFLVDDLVSTEDEIEWVVKRLRNHRSGGGVRDAGRTHEKVADGSNKYVEGHDDDGGGGYDE